jgi:hypothetical protein
MISPKVRKMEKFMTEVLTKKFELNEKKELKQNARNAFRSDAVDDMVADFQSNGKDAVEIKEGIAVQYPNDELGSLVVIWSPTVKPLDFDIATAVEEFAKDNADKIAKAEKAKVDKEAKIAKTKAEKEAKAKKATK